jgi:hypothetical protein
MEVEIMRKQKKIRLAKMLFTKDSAFKPRVVRDRTKYTRKEKYKKVLTY